MELIIMTLVCTKQKRRLSVQGEIVSKFNNDMVCCLNVAVPFIVKLQSIFSIQWSNKLSNHRLRLLPLIPPQHSHMGHQPRNCADCHAANFSLNVVCDLLHSPDTGNCQKKGRMWLEKLDCTQKQALWQKKKWMNFYIAGFKKRKKRTWREET